MYNKKTNRPAGNKAANRNKQRKYLPKAEKRQAKTELPVAQKYYATEGIRLTGKGEWRDAICPFHADTTPSLRVNINSGGFRCMACGAKGGDIIAFHMKRHGLRFIETMRALEVMA